MSDTPELPETPGQRQQKEFEDHHFHDDDEIVPVDDIDPAGTRPPIRRKPQRKLPPRRRYDED